jgi:hypothetical protein
VLCVHILKCWITPIVHLRRNAVRWSVWKISMPIAALKCKGVSHCQHVPRLKAIAQVHANVHPSH